MKFNLEQLINHVNLSVENSNNNISKLTSEILSIDGMSGNKTRHLYNNICSLNGANYLEIGTWKGSSFISALYGNDINSIAIDNWVEFNGPKDEFISNVDKFCPDRKFKFIEKDCFKIADDEIKSVYDSIDIYLFDGAHDYESQRKFEKLIDGFDSEVINIGADKYFTINEVANKVSEISKKYGYNPTIEYGEPRHEVKHAYCNHDKVKNLLDFNDETDIDNLIESMFIWYKEIPNKEVKKIDYEIEKNIYSYWK